MQQHYKILLSAYACEPKRGSEPGVGWNWAIEIAKRGHQVWVLTRRNNKRLIEIQRDNVPHNLQFIYYDLPPVILKIKKLIGVNLYYMLWQIGVFTVVRKKHREIRFDLIHHLTFGVFRNVSYLSFLQIPFVFGPVGGGERAPFKLRKNFHWVAWTKDLFRDILNGCTYINPLYRRMLKNSSLVLVKTNETLKLIPPAYRKKAKVHLEIGVKEIPNRLKNKTNVNEKFTVLYVGRFVCLKGVHLILAAFSNFLEKHQNAELVLIGSGPAESQLKKIQKKLGIANVQWICWLDQQELMKYYQSSDVFLFPSLHDSSGNVVLEALSNALPVICLDLGGPPLIMNDSDCIVQTNKKTEPQVVDLLTEKLVTFASDKNLLIKKKTKSAERAKSFLWPNVVGSIYTEIEEELKER